MINKKTDIFLKQLAESSANDEALVGATDSGQTSLTFPDDSWTGWAKRLAMFVTVSPPQGQEHLLAQLQDMSKVTNQFLHTRNIRAIEVEAPESTQTLTRANVKKLLEDIKSSHKYAYDTILNALTSAHMQISGQENSDAMLQQAIHSIQEQLNGLDEQKVKEVLPEALRQLSAVGGNTADVVTICSKIASIYDVDFQLDESQPPESVSIHSSDDYVSLDNYNPEWGEIAKDGDHLLHQHNLRTQEHMKLADTQVIRHHKNLSAGEWGTVDQIQEGEKDPFRARKTTRHDGAKDSQKAQDELQRMENEHEIMSSLDHPHILKVTGSRPVTETIKVVHEHEEGDGFIHVDRVEDGQAGLQTELAVGNLDPDGNLLPSLSMKERLKCCLQIMEATAYMNNKGIAHLDLKPENILYTPEKGAMIADFGFAQKMQPATGGNSSQVKQENCMPMRYSAPERAQLKYYDGPKADAWSLAMTMGELLTNDSPMDSEIIKNAFLERGSPFITRGYMGWIHPDAIEAGIYSFLERQRATLEGLYPLFGDMLQPEPEYRLSAEEALDKYRDLLERMIEEA